MSGKKKNDMIVRFWGVRGSIPTPERDFLKYGGNTPCVELRCGETILIFDAGTGLKNLGLSLIKEFGNKPQEINLLLSHTHWDHIQGFPFFSYIYMENKTINIYGGHHFMETKSLLAGQMSKEYFPVKLEDLPASIKYIDLLEDPVKINNITVYHTHLLHPELSLGFRVEYKDKVFVYATDNELVKDTEMPGFNIENIGQLIKDADLLVAECQYTSKEYPEKVGWGHSTIEGVIDISIKYGVKNLYTFHHDPYHNDDKLDEMLEEGKKRAGRKIKIFASRDGMEVKI